MRLALRYLLFPFVLLFGATWCGCNTIKDEASATARTVVDCTKATAIDAIITYGPTVEQVLVDSINGQGKLDKDRAKAAVKSYASDTARCVLAATLARLMKPPSSDPNAPQAEPITIDLAALQELRKEQLGEHIRYKLPDGGTL